MNFYMAIATSTGFSVAVDNPENGRPIRINDVRDFESFDQADSCAKRIASGEFKSFDNGIYVNSR